MVAGYWLALVFQISHVVSEVTTTTTIIIMIIIIIIIIIKLITHSNNNSINNNKAAYDYDYDNSIVVLPAIKSDYKIIDKP